jgi:predicted alpha-1,2-mannosidase
MTFLSCTRDFDAELAWKAIHHDLTTPGVPFGERDFAGNRHLGSYMKHGYVTEEDGPASSTLEYAYDDWAAAQLGLALGKTADANELLKRSQNYRNTFDKTVGSVRRRHADGSWVEPFDPFAYGTEGGWNGPGFVEGTPWHYTWFVPHDLPGLIGLLGEDRFNSMLEEGFQKGHVDLTNQPNLQAPFLFNHSGRPWLTQKYTHQVLRDHFEPTPYVGWRGEEDEGQLRAYFALLSMGLFQMDGGCGAESAYDLTGPLFDKIEIRLDSHFYKGGTFTIEAHNRSEENIYIQSATLNGEPLQRARLPHSAIAAGGRLIYEMGPNPNPNWGKQRF